MVVEGRDFVDFGLRELHLARKRRYVRGGEIAVAVLDPVQVLDQQVAAPRLVFQQRLDLPQRAGIDRTPLGPAARIAAALLLDATAFRPTSSQAGPQSPPEVISEQ